MVFEAATFVHFNGRGGLLFNGEGGGDARVGVLHHVDERADNAHDKSEQDAHHNFDSKGGDASVFVEFILELILAHAFMVIQKV
jgi:hypothetical protein